MLKQINKLIGNSIYYCMKIGTKKYIKQILWSTIFFAIIYLLVTCLLYLSAATPNPGHPWAEVGDGWWAATGTTALHTFTFPDANATVITTNSPVTVAQGGTGANSTSSAMNILSGLIAKGDIFVQGISVIGRLVVGVNNSVLVTNSAQALGMYWATPPATPAGSDTYVQFNNGGVLGAVSSFVYNKVSQTLALQGDINLTAQTDPPASPSGTINIYVKKVSGRTLLKAIGPYGIDYSYQPSFFQNSIFMISTGAGTAYNNLGNTLTSVGTISHVVSEPLGYMANQVTGTLAGNTAGTGSATTPYFIGSQYGSNGFFFVARMVFPDATSTGARIFVGFTSGTMAASVSADNPAGSNIGWQYSTVRGDTGWKFMTSNGVSQTVSSTILPVDINKVFDFFIYCPPYPNNGTVYYRVDNITDTTTAEGSTGSNLPVSTTPLRAGFQLNNISAAAKNLRLNRLYVETDQ
jgi:hypothetical protein